MRQQLVQMDTKQLREGIVCRMAYVDSPSTSTLSTLSTAHDMHFQLDGGVVLNPVAAIALWDRIVALPPGDQMRCHTPRYAVHLNFGENQSLPPRFAGNAITFQSLPAANTLGDNLMGNRRRRSCSLRTSAIWSPRSSLNRSSVAAQHGFYASSSAHLHSLATGVGLGTVFRSSNIVRFV